MSKEERYKVFAQFNDKSDKVKLSTNFCWDMNTNIVRIIAAGLRQLAKNANSYPVGVKYEDWIKQLITLAEKFEFYLCDAFGEFTKKQLEILKQHNIDPSDSSAVEGLQIQICKEALQEFTSPEVFFNLWD